jgi:hypothetical protein
MFASIVFSKLQKNDHTVEQKYGEKQVDCTGFDYICGDNARKPFTGSWYDLIALR